MVVSAAPMNNHVRTILYNYSHESNVSSIRLFILSSFAALGPTHGHRIRTEAEAKRVPLWTDISVGAVYGAINRLAEDGSLREVRRETEGNRPPRILYEITDAGRATLATLQRETLETIWFKYDPFDLALTSAGAIGRMALRETIANRIETLKTMIKERGVIIAEALKCINELDEWALRHSTYRLDGEVRYLLDLLQWLDRNAPET
jgi:DNA-binding PadR family transcriptional regulator